MKKALSYDRLRVLVIILLVVLFVYDQAIFFYAGFNAFLYYAAVPTFIILGLILAFYIPASRKMRKESIIVFESSADSRAAVELLEAKVVQLRESAAKDPSRLPEFAKRLAALSAYYREIDRAKSKKYAEEALECINDPRYPEDSEALETKKEVRLIIEKLM